MADDFAEFDDDDDFILEDEDGPSNRPFILAFMGLVGVLLVSLIVLGVYVAFFNNPTTPPTEEEVVAAALDSPQAQEATQISATNEAIETQNAYVTQTLESRQMTDEAPTESPTEIPATETPEPTATEALEVVEGEAGGEGEAGAGDENSDEATTGEESGAATGEEVNAEATSIFSDVNTVTPSADDGVAVAVEGDVAVEEDAADGGVAVEADVDANADGANEVVATDAAAVEQLPDTGFGVWGIIAAAFTLLFLFVGARRLRTD